jgi:hypothetical protein
MKRSIFLFLMSGVFLSTALAQKEVPLLRDEVSMFKKKLVTMFDALGEVPAGYSKEDEDFNLPTEAYPGRSAGKFNPVHCSATRTCGTEKAVAKTNANLEKEYKKKMMEAQAKGDYMAMQKLAQEMQQKMGQTQVQAVDSHKEPIDISVSLNAFTGATIDPDAVVLEKPGMIALKREDEVGSGKGTITVYFDPVSLKDTKQLSSVRLESPEAGISKRSGVLTATIELRGPLVEIEPWVKRIDTKKVLSLIDGAK